MRELIKLSADEKLDFETSKTGLDLFGDNAEKYPDKIASADEIYQMIYSELDNLSDKISSWLIENGVQENELVIVKIGRVKEFAAAIIGIHKSGAA